MPRPDPLPRKKPRKTALDRYLNPKRPKRPEGGEPIPAILPRGPVPLAGGAEAPIL